MERRASGNRPTREPVRSPWVWVTMTLIVLAGVPFYLPAGTIRPLVLGLPYWVVLSLVCTLLFAAFTSWLCLRWWNLVEDAEEADAGAARGAGGGRPGDGGAPWTD